MAEQVPAPDAQLCLMRLAGWMLLGLGVIAVAACYTTDNGGRERTGNNPPPCFEACVRVTDKCIDGFMSTCRIVPEPVCSTWDPYEECEYGCLPYAQGCCDP